MEAEDSSAPGGAIWLDTAGGSNSARPVTYGVSLNIAGMAPPLAGTGLLEAIFCSGSLAIDVHVPNEESEEGAA